MHIIRPRRSRSAAAYRPSRQTFPWTICRSVRTYSRRSVGRSVCPVHCSKTADRIRMPFPGMRQVVGFGDRSTGRGTFGANLSVREHISETAGPIFTKFVVHILGGRGSVFLCNHCNQWELYGVCVRQRRDAPSSQITLGKLVIIIYLLFIKTEAYMHVSCVSELS